MNRSKDIENRMLRYLLSGQERITDPVLTDWIAESDSNKSIFLQYKKIWTESGYYIEQSAFDTEHSWQKLNEKNREKAKAGKIIKNVCFAISGAAASLLILFALSATDFFNSQTEIVSSTTTAIDNATEVVLPDGSVVKLNSGSEINFSYNPKKKIREVIFHGEGFFDVSKRKDPFVVKMSNNLEIRVFGTSFNLRAYDKDHIVKAALVEGHIEMSYLNDKLPMKSGEIAVFDKQTKEMKHIDGILSHTYGWLEKKLYMDEMSLNEVCKYLERWYNVNINLEQGLGENIHYHGVIQEETITDVLDALSRLSDIKYQIKGNNICITDK